MGKDFSGLDLPALGTWICPNAIILSIKQSLTDLADLVLYSSYLGILLYYYFTIGHNQHY